MDVSLRPQIYVQIRNHTDLDWSYHKCVMMNISEEIRIFGTSL